MADVAADIDAYLRKQGSPMAGLGNVFVAAGKKYGVDPRLVVGISGAESSFGKHNFGSFNAFGWGPGDNFSSWPEAINTVTRGLRQGYLNQGRTTPATISGKWAPSGAANDPTNLNAHWAGNVSSFMQELGASPSASKGAPEPTPGAATLVENKATQALGPSTLPKVPSFDPEPIIASGLNFSPEMNVRRLVTAMLAAPNGPTTVPATTVPKAIPKTAIPTPWTDRAMAGQPVLSPSSVGSQHDTSGLPGYPAHDFMAPAGTTVVAPVSGKIFKLSGHNPALGPTQGVHGPFGLSLYIHGSDGRNYYLTHLGSRNVRLGQRVKAGQPIGTVGNYAKWGGADHVHMGVSV